MGCSILVYAFCLGLQIHMQGANHFSGTSSVLDALCFGRDFTSLRNTVYLGAVGLPDGMALSSSCGCRSCPIRMRSRRESPQPSTGFGTVYGVAIYGLSQLAL